ncbi:MAG: hypothetical protein FWD61_15860 [Phycisphaerales bacterium]|nr:hypothetical protein [Phycisphaerales bacterium]
MGLLNDAIPERYEKNPILIVVENFILDAIGKLAPEKEQRLSEMLCRTFGGTDWRATVRHQMDLPPETAEQLQAEWQRSLAESDAKQEDAISPEDFARAIAGALFEGRG